MPFTVAALNVMLSGPGDVKPYLDIVETVVLDWNRERSKYSSVVLIPRHWSTDSVSSFSLGSGGQAEINQQLVRDADVVFAIFHANLGTATDRAVSGTAEEIDEAIDNGTFVHVFFCEQSLPYGHDPKQYAKLKAFRTSLEARGLYRAFTTDDELRGLVRQHLESDVASVNAPQASEVEDVPAKGAVLRVRFDYREVTETDSKGRTRTRKKGQRIVVSNEGLGAAHNVTLVFTAEGEGAPLRVHTYNGEVPTFKLITPEGGEVSVPAIVFMGVATNQRATLRWHDDDGEVRSYTQTISLF